jgi:hypothetical protein
MKILILRALLMSAIFTTNAHAYVDGGTALLLLQGLFAGIGACLVFFKKPWQFITKLFSRDKKNDA